ncbi:hypothetical protein GCM10027570_14110 [Streptomonospora sediminis]
MPVGEDFRSRPADYFAMLSELGFLTEDEEKTHGDLPEEIIEPARQVFGPLTGSVPAAKRQAMWTGSLRPDTVPCSPRVRPAASA